MKPETITKQIFKIIPALLLVALSAFLLQGMMCGLLDRYLLALVLGVAAMPLTGDCSGDFRTEAGCFQK